MRQYEHIRDLIDRVRRRWRTLHGFGAAMRAGLAATAVLAAAVVAARWSTGAPLALVVIALVAVVLVVAGIVWSVWPLRAAPGDRQVARFIEEREPALDDRLVSAVEVASPTAADRRPSALADAMLTDAARRAADVDVDAIVPVVSVRRAALRAAAAMLLLAIVTVAARSTIRQAYDAAALTLFPARIALDVSPGNARLKAGSPLTIDARLVGNSAPVVAQMQVADGDGWRSADMTTVEPGRFRLAIEAVTSSFTYRVVAGTVVSPTFSIVAAHAPRVARIDVEYSYPAGLGLAPRTERDSGDIYAPAGTDVKVHVIADRPAATGRLTLGNGRTIDLQGSGPTELTTSLHVADDSSYRVALVDREGLSTAGETEYFIRVLEDRPPDVRILKPAADRAVTRLEEVDIEAQAEDDYGIDRLDLVYAVSGGIERVASLDIPRHRATVTGRHTLFLEDLDVHPGDFVSYYVRARDLTRGTRPNEARSDIFFLEVKPYEQEFALAQSQNSAGAGGGQNSIDDLVAAQKEIIVSTWKLDRRAQAAKGARSEEDIRTVGRAEAELKARVEQASSTFRESTMRDPRRRTGRGGGRGAPQPPELRAGQTLPEEDAMGLAAEAMGKAVVSLDALKTNEARPPELEALTHLLKAQADVRKREVMRQQAGSGAGNNRSNYDLSTLFDKELQKQQQTNYETKSSAEQKDDRNQNALDKIRELARRQDELLKRQQDLARNRERMTEEELRRELEKLTREQSELRQRAEDMARQMASQQQQQQQPSSSNPQQQNAKANQAGQQTSSGQPSQSQESKSGSSSGGQTGQQMRDVSEAMRSATNDLRRRDAKEASASGSRALDKLRDLERQMQSVQPDERRRAVGEMQLEARQLADAERQVASELSKTAPGEPGKDAVRRLAGEQQRLADRARALQDSLKRQGAAGSEPRAGDRGSDPGSADAKPQATAADAARDLERQKLAERMQQSADAMRNAADRPAAPQRGTTAPAPASDEARGQVGPQQEMARALDRLADKLSTSTGAKDAESRKLSDQMARVQDLKNKIDALSGEMKQMAQANGRAGQSGGQRGQSGASPSAATTPGESGRTGAGQQGGGGGSGAELARLRDEYQRALQQTRDLMDQLRRDDPSSPTYARGGVGATFEGQGMTLSAPGTEAFKQDFARWEDLRRQATQALEAAETVLSKKLQAKESKERLAAGADDKAPPEYRQQVDDYFKAIAKKKPGT